ncbi:MAG: hypothetical protein HYY48_05550 [Gammaproteobacteria bacterium]|nr:hypothetical protein [Gammaproteobacteria bacterium]
MLESTLETVGQSSLVGPTTSTRKNASLYARVQKPETLDRAWRVIQENGLKSDSRETREDIRQFSIQSRRHLNRLNRQLRTRRFRFEPARGALVRKKKGKSERPIVIAPIESRIVQRAILDVVQSIPEIQRTLTAGYNFGGIAGPEFGVPPAIAKAVSAGKESKYYIKTDIKSFFTAVPRQRAVDLIKAHTFDPQFNALLVEATTTELKDLQSFGDKLRLFPLCDEGVAQGSCLSPLLCNLLLADFDVQMNRRGIICIRYIDDFILFAPSQKAAFKALQYALELLQEMGLSAYDPRDSNPVEREKSSHGQSIRGFTFLGCDIQQDRIRPTRAKRSELKQKTRTILHECLNSISDPRTALFSRKTSADAILDASRIIRGWGNTYSFCNDERLFHSLDLELQNIFVDFQRRFGQKISSMEILDRRRSFGLFPLVDCNQGNK